jgi:uncharacterized protein YggT (Ycf19 family)
MKQKFLGTDIVMGNFMDANLPLFVILLDYLLGAAMWTLIGRFGMSIFLSENSNFFFMRMFVIMTDPMLRITRPITPSFLVVRLHPLYTAWFIFMFRFYVMPLVLGYSVLGVLSFPLESEISRIIYDVGQILN